MPVSKNPGDLKTGPGKQVPAAWTNKIVLSGSGMVGADINIGQPGWIDPLGATRALPDWIRVQMEAAGSSLFSHVEAPNNAHPASAISIDGHPSIPLWGNNVESAIDELTGRVPPRPPLLGEWMAWTEFTAIPDWGVAKLADSTLITRALLTTTTAGADMFPYYWEAPSPTLDDADPEWDEIASPSATAWFHAKPGQDPDTDFLFNTGSPLTGAGGGNTFAGGFTRDGLGVDDPVIESLRISLRPTTLAVAGPGVGLPVRQEVIVSGAVFPADRGVLALIRWPAGVRNVAATPADFLAQDPEDRVIAALLLGQGVIGDKCKHFEECGEHVCDGDAGGIFAVGANGINYDPFAYPGQASGQYDLIEIHTGGALVDGTALKPPYNDYTGLGDGKRQQNGTIPGAGQVRLGTDSESDKNDTYPFPAMEWGIPILGATHLAYNPAPPAGYEGTGGQMVSQVGDSVLLDAATAVTGFFGYRLPYLKDYTPEGLKWTPGGNDPLASREKARYFSKPISGTALTYRDGSAVPATLETAGHYQNPFNEDYWPWQIARYRHCFLLPSTVGPTEKEDIGSYWMVHFKKEEDFEAFARDGVMPWDATDGYGLYGSSLIDNTDFEAQGNLVNQETSALVAAPAGPAPTYGYGADSYHPLRSSFLLDPNDPLTSMPLFTSAFTYTVGNALGGGSENVTFISGVAYFIPRDITTGAASFELNTLTIGSDAPHGFWDSSYRVDSDALTGGTAAPALVSGPNPMFLGLAAFGYADNGGSPLSITVPAGAPGVGTATTRNVRTQRVEVPFTYLGSNGSGLFTSANGPAEIDALNFALTGGNLTLLGDATFPSFSKDAQVRAFFRRPLGHASVDESALPFTAAAGHGIIVPNGNSDTTLIHTTQWDAANVVGNYGNFVTAGAGGPFPSPGVPASVLPLKDVEERFLDETYRHPALLDDTVAITTPYGTVAAVKHLNGPGMAGWVAGPMEVPVRMGVAPVAWDNVSWLQLGYHESVLVSSVYLAGLQVSGLPDMNIPLADGANAPWPSAGLLMYPTGDFNDPNIRPLGSVDAGTDFTGSQPDYSGVATTNLLNFIRAFDAAFSHDASPETGVDGQPFVVFQLLGIKLADFAYGAPGPGQQENTGLSIQLKVPGLTTWMDVGRVDGGGPSKQDAALDGAGCQIVGAQTFDGIDAATGMVYCQIKCNVGPAANLFKNIGAIGGGYQGSGEDPKDEVPVMVKVTMRGAVGYDLENEHNGGFFVGAATAGTSAGDRRGLVTMKVIRPSTL